MPVLEQPKISRIYYIMRKSILRSVLALSGAAFLLLQSCKDDSNLTIPPPVADQSFGEEFDTLAAAKSRGWIAVNKSYPLGSVWQDGGAVPAFFNAYSNNSSNIGFAGAEYTSTSAGVGTISNWLISPVTLMQNGDKITFYTRAQRSVGYTATDVTDWANRMQVRLNLNDTTGDFDATNPYSVGSFSKVALDINENYYEWHAAPGSYGTPAVVATLGTIAKAYPTEWTKFEVTISGLSHPKKGRFAFRYFLEKAGSAGRGSGIGIDKVTYKGQKYF